MTSGNKGRFGGKQVWLAVTIIGIIAISGVVIGFVSWNGLKFSANKSSSTSSVELPPMALTLVGLNGSKLVLNQTTIGNFTPFESNGGFKTSVGMLEEIGNYTGVKVTDLLALVGGMNCDCCLNVSASDGYSMVYTYDQVQGENFTCYSPATGDEVLPSEPLTMMLAYYENGVNLTSDKGPLRLALVGSQGVLTDGHFWIKFVTTLEIIPSVVDWTLALVGPYSDNMSRATFESGANANCHQANWTDSNQNVWSGMPLWYLIGWIDDKGDANRMEFNDTLALEGYTIKITNGLGSYVLLNSTTVMHNDLIIVANSLNGAPLPNPYWPLRLVGAGVSSDQMLSNIVEIQMIMPAGS